MCIRDSLFYVLTLSTSDTKLQNLLSTANQQQRYALVYNFYNMSQYVNVLISGRLATVRVLLTTWYIRRSVIVGYGHCGTVGIKT